MRQRLALALSAIVAAAVLAVGLTAAGFAPDPRPVAAEEAEVTAREADVEDAQPEVVYIRPAPQPKTVVVKERVQEQRSGSTKRSSQPIGASRSGDDDDDRRERRRESAKERREDRREEAKERREREHEREDEDDD